MDYRNRLVGELPLPAGSPVWLAHLAGAVAGVDRTEFLSCIEDFAALADSAARSPSLCPDLLLHSDHPGPVPFSLSLADSGGWGRVSIATVNGVGDSVSLGVDLSPSECRLLARSLLSMARFLERTYPEHAA